MLMTQTDGNREGGTMKIEVHQNAGDNWTPKAKCGEKLTVGFVGVAYGQESVTNNPGLVTCAACLKG